MPNAADSASDQIATHVINIMRVSSGMQKNVLAFLARTEQELVTALTNSGNTVNRQARLEALLKQTSASITAGYADINKSVRADLQGVARMEGKSAVSIVNKAIGVPVVSVQVPESLLARIVDETAVLGHKPAEWWKGQDADLRRKFSAVVQRGVYAGQGIDEMVRQVRGTSKNGFKDGIMETSRRNAETLVRSAVISVSNQARLDSYGAMSDVVKGVEWIATLDTRTTVICRALDRHMWRLPDYAPIGHDKHFPGPTAHWNCRSTQVPVLRSWEELSGKKLESLDNATLQERLKEKLAAKGWDAERIAKATADTRASMDGQVSNGFDFEKWLHTKGDAFANQLLGPGRFALWKSGKLSLADMVNQDSRPLTLEQMHASIQSGKPPPESTAAAFLPLIVLPSNFSQTVQAKINDTAATQIENIKQQEPDSLQAKHLRALDGSALSPADQLSQATINATIEAASLIKADALAVLKVSAEKAGTLARALQDGTVQRTMLAIVNRGGAKFATIEEWLQTLNADEQSAFKASVKDSVKANPQKRDAATILASLGVKEIDLPRSVVMKNYAVQAVETLIANGFPPPPSITKGDYGKKFPAFGGRNGIGLSTANYTAEEFKKQVRSGWLSQENVVLHESGHVEHVKSSGDLYDAYSTWSNRATQEKIAGQVSRYSMKNPKEFVAEVFAGYLAGHMYSDEVMTMYKRYQGPVLPENPVISTDAHK